MKERSIIFSGEMVRTILEGRKTMTRRAIKEQPPVDGRAMPWIWDIDGKSPRYALGWRDDEDICCAAVCRYGQPGDRLWVQETWCYFPDNAPDGMGENTYYLASQKNLKEIESVMRINKVQWKPSIFMPRWASRINLEITGIRVERLQEIPGKDCLREGIRNTIEGKLLLGSHLVYSFREIWDALNAKRGYPWESNPWVWVISFKKL